VETIKYYDLDGTLSKLNNSYDFAYGYYKHHKKYLRYIIVRLLHFIVKRIFILSLPVRRKIILTAMFHRLRKDKLLDYYKKEYHLFFEKELSSLGREVKNDDNSKHIMLTGCTEVPAYIIGEYFGFGKVICTTFKSEGDLIKGISIDTFGNYKAQYIQDNKTKYIIYYTDDELTEGEVKKKVNQFVVVE
jgi:hypothetical protein